MLFLANKLPKMKQGGGLGSHVAEAHNGSSLFTGSAGQGESNIRLRWPPASPCGAWPSACFAAARRTGLRAGARQRLWQGLFAWISLTGEQQSNSESGSELRPTPRHSSS